MNESESQVRLRCQLLHLQCGSVSWLGLGLVRMSEAGRQVGALHGRGRGGKLVHVY